MKKLILIDHLGDHVMDFDVYVEGKDFQWEANTPTPVWLGQLLLLDPESYDQWLRDKEKVEDVSLVSESEVEVKPEDFDAEIAREAAIVLEVEIKETPYMTAPMFCSTCSWRGARGDCRFGHDDYLCPNCGTETLEEVKEDELEAVDNQDTGDRGAGEAGEHEDTETLHRDEGGGEPDKRSKKPRKRKAA